MTDSFLPGLFDPNPESSGLGGQSFLRSGITMNARTLMLEELSDLLQAVPDQDAPEATYGAAVLEDNCTGRKTLSARQKTWMYLKRLYRCDPRDSLFSAFRMLWDAAPESRPLLAFQMAWTADPSLRKSTEFFLPLADGAEISSESTAAWVRAAYPSLSPPAAASTARNLNSTWQQAGFIEGSSVRRRRRAAHLPENAAFALWLGAKSGLSGSLLFETPMCALLDRPPSDIIALAEVAARRGLIGLNRIDTVIEVSFPHLPRPEDRP